MKKLLLLENHHEIDIPEELIRIINSPWSTSNYEVEKWIQFQSSYWPKNRNETVKRLFEADAFIAHHVFVNWCQLEIFIEILTKFKEKEKSFSFFIMNGMLLETFQKWYTKYEAYTTPDTDEYNDSPELRIEFKQNLNKKFLECLEYHSIYEINEYSIEEKDGLIPIKTKDILCIE